jgi:hypothetical protein
MKPEVRTRSRRFVVLPLAAIALTAAATAGCSQPSGAPAQPAGNPAPQAQQQPGDTAGGGSEKTQQKRFPNTSFPALITGYDVANGGMLKFKVAKVEKPEQGANYLVEDPNDPLEHRLPLAKNAAIKSLSVLCPGGSGGVEERTCSASEMVSGLTGEGEIPADEIKVNADDEIELIQERWQP